MEVQTADLTRYCQQKGWTLKRLFVEPGSSATCVMSATRLAEA